MIEHYPDNQTVQGALAAGVEHMGRMRTGSWSVHQKNCHREVEQFLNDRTTPMAARHWLERFEQGLRTESERAQISELNEEVNEWGQVPGDPAAPERLWAPSVCCSITDTEINYFRVNFLVYPSYRSGLCLAFLAPGCCLRPCRSARLLNYIGALRDRAQRGSVFLHGLGFPAGRNKGIFGGAQETACKSLTEPS
jgi:hypothetical protein